MVDKQKCTYFVRIKLTQSNPNMKRKSLLKTFGMCVLATLLIACSDNYSEFNPFNQGGTPLLLTGSIEQECLTRINDYGFVSGDRMGIYVVDYSNGQAGQLHASDNRASNVLYTFNADTYTWSAPTILYWRDSETPVDVYGYYPGANAISDPMAYTFEVQADQNIPAADGSISSYEQSDLLWGKVSRVKPTTEAIVVHYNHILAGVRVNLQKGTGISDTEWEKLEKIVLVDNTIRTSTVDLSTGTVTPTGSVDRGIRMLQQSEDYRAVVIPQTVAAGKTLISITIDGTTYSHTLTSPMKYQTGKLHNFTITINKRAASGDYELKFTDGGITPWTNDESSHQFSANAYVVVDCDRMKVLKKKITEAGYDYKTIKNLKVTGKMTTEDFFFLRNEMPALTNLNLKDVKVVRGLMNEKDYVATLEYGRQEYVDDVIPDQAFYCNKTIRSLILPSTVTRIGKRAFGGMDLRYSTLEIPEGVVDIGRSAFSQDGSPENYQVELILPYSLKTIGDYAFCRCPYNCELKLTDNITYIGISAFGDCKFFHGSFHVPSKLKSLSSGMFGGLGNNIEVYNHPSLFTGEIDIPEGFTEIPGDEAFRIAFANRIDLKIPVGVKKIGGTAFWGLKMNSLVLPEGLEQIGVQAFGSEYGRTSDMPFPLHLPNSLLTIDDWAFAYTNIEGELVLPEKIAVIHTGAFAHNRLSEVSFSNQLEHIEEKAFYHNEDLTKVTLPKYLDAIGDMAFASCGSLQTIISLNPDPPVLGDDVWFDAPFDKVILQVPESAVEAYRHAEGWNQFQNITAYHELAFNIPVIKTLDKGGRREGIVRAEGAWEVVECPSWCHVSPMSGVGKTQVAVIVDGQSKGASERNGRIVLSLKGKNYTTYTDIQQYAYEYAEDETIILQKASSGASKAIPLFIVGDGFDAGQIASGEYMQVVREQMEHFFSIEPFKSYRDEFTVSTAVAVSEMSGVGTASAGAVDNRFGTVLATDGLEGNDNALFDYAVAHGEAITQERLSETTILVVGNAAWAKGNASIYDDGKTISYVTLSPDAYPYDQRGMVLHYVCGLGFGKLAPEYLQHYTFIQSCTCSYCNDLGKYRQAKALGWYENITLSSKMNESPWSHLIFHPRYSSIVNMFEGGYRHSRGVYRSEAQSVMNTFIPYFNTISRESIVRRIKRYAGEEYSFDDFLAKDKIEIPEQ